MLLKLKSFFQKLIGFFITIGKKIHGVIANVFSLISKKIKDLANVMKKWEKITIIFLLLVIIILSLVMAYRAYLKQTHLVPARGESYIEGIVADNKAEVDQIIQKLTKIGLTYFDNEDKLVPAICEKWEISSDNKTYTFYLKDGFDSGKISEIIKSHKNGWSDIAIETPESKIIKFTLKEPYSPFLNNTAQPILEYGPYELKKQDKTELVFTPRENFVFGRPYLDEIVIKLFPDEDNLRKALDQSKINALAYVNIDEKTNNFNNYSLDLPRYLVAFFNLNKEQFQDKNVRQKIKKDEKLDNDVTALLVTTDKSENVAKAEEFENKWAEKNLKINIEKHDTVELQKDIIPGRNYDMILYGIDYGYDPDPYPFWHTSQMSSAGLNLSNFSNQKADALMEEGRQTTDENARAEKYKQFQTIIDDEVPAIFLEKMAWNWAASNIVRGVVSHKGVIPADRYNEVWKWYIKERRVKK